MYSRTKIDEKLIIKGSKEIKRKKISILLLNLKFLLTDHYKSTTTGNKKCNSVGLFMKKSINYFKMTV